MMRLDRAGGGGETEHEIERCDDLEGPAIAMALHGLDPFGVDDTGAHDAGDLFFERADLEVFRPGRIEVPGGGLYARKGFDGSREPALELVILVGIEQIVLGVVLGVEDGVGGF